MSTLAVYADTWKEMYLFGKNTKEIAEQYGCSDDSVCRILKQNGVEFNSHRKSRILYDQHYFDCIDTEEKAYWLGFLAADGCVEYSIDKAVYRVSLSLAMKDKGHVEAFSKAISNTKKIVVDRDAFRINLNGMHICETLISYGIIPNKSLVLQFPKKLDPIYYQHFVRGYFDGDGCIHIGEKYKQLNILGTEDILTNIRELFHQNAGSTNVKILQVPKKNVFKLQYNGRLQIKAIGNWMYNNATIYLKRKKDKFDLL